jgi:hypothetical protein
VFVIVSQQKSTPNRPALVFKKQALLGKNKRRPMMQLTPTSSGMIIINPFWMKL